MALIKQYVNLNPDRAAELDGLDKARAGRDVVFEATVDPVATGIAVVFEITRGAKNVTEAGTVSKVVKTTGDDGKAKLPFVLTPHGGDEFTVKASLSVEAGAGAQLGEDTYVVWRRIYYQMSRFDAGVPGQGQAQGSVPAIPAFDISAVTAELTAREHNIELVDKTQAALITRRATVLTRDDDSLVLKRALLDSYDATLVPVTLRIVVANQIAEVKTGNMIQYGVEQRARQEMDLPNSRLFDDPTCAKNADWFVSATWTIDSGATGALDVKYFDRTPEGDLYVNFENEVPWDRGSVEESETVDVKLTYRYIAGFCNGTSFHNSIALSSKDARGKARLTADMVDTAMHEIGHFLHLAAPDQATYYTLHGHNGPHCFTGVKESKLAGQDYSGEDGTCIMYGESGAKRTSKFCAACDPSMRKSTVQRPGMPSDPTIVW
jgi:hypothetical protein